MPSDFSIIDGLELVTYVPAGGSSIDDLRALRRPLTQSRQRNVERYVKLEAKDAIFFLDAEPLGMTPMAVGDTLIDRNSALYTVLFLERQTLEKTIAFVVRPVV